MTSWPAAAARDALPAVVLQTPAQSGGRPERCATARGEGAALRGLWRAVGHVLARLDEIGELDASGDRHLLAALRLAHAAATRAAATSSRSRDFPVGTPALGDSIELGPS